MFVRSFEILYPSFYYLKSDITVIQDLILRHHFNQGDLVQWGPCLQRLRTLVLRISTRCHVETIEEVKAKFSFQIFREKQFACDEFGKWFMYAWDTEFSRNVELMRKWSDSLDRPTWREFLRDGTLLSSRATPLKFVFVNRSHTFQYNFPSGWIGTLLF